MRPEKKPAAVNLASSRPTPTPEVETTVTLRTNGPVQGQTGQCEYIHVCSGTTVMTAFYDLGGTKLFYSFHCYIYSHVKISIHLESNSREYCKAPICTCSSTHMMTNHMNIYGLVFIKMCSQYRLELVTGRYELHKHSRGTIFKEQTHIQKSYLPFYKEYNTVH